MISQKQLKANARKALKNTFGFSSFKAAREYLVNNAKDGYIIIKRNGLEVFYADNCKPGYQFQIGGNFKGMHITVPF